MRHSPIGLGVWHPHGSAPPLPRRRPPGGQPTPRKCPAYVTVAVTQLPSNSLRPVPSSPDRRVCLRGLPPPACRPDITSERNPIASPSLPARRSARFRPPKKHGRSGPSPPSPHSPPKNTATPGDGGFHGATRIFRGAGSSPLPSVDPCAMRPHRGMDANPIPTHRTGAYRNR
jgi:hypothetical protein